MGKPRDAVRSFSTAIEKRRDAVRSLSTAIEKRRDAVGSLSTAIERPRDAFESLCVAIEKLTHASESLWVVIERLPDASESISIAFEALSDSSKSLSEVIDEPSNRFTSRSAAIDKLTVPPDLHSIAPDKLTRASESLSIAVWTFVDAWTPLSARPLRRCGESYCITELLARSSMQPDGRSNEARQARTMGTVARQHGATRRVPRVLDQTSLECRRRWQTLPTVVPNANSVASTTPVRRERSKWILVEETPDAFRTRRKARGRATAARASAGSRQKVSCRYAPGST